MLDSDAYCPDILTQASAAQAALGSFSRVLMENHIRTCVTQDIQQGKEGAVEELVETLKKFMK